MGAVLSLAPAFANDGHAPQLVIAGPAPDDGVDSPMRPGDGPSLTLPSDPSLLGNNPDLPGDADFAGPLPPIHYDPAQLPSVVRQTREAIIAAAKSGELEALRPIIQVFDPPPRFSALEDGDPIDILASISGDESGREVLAIMLDVLDAGWVRVDEGTPRERFVWPYFAGYPPDKLDPRQMVELFRIITGGEFEMMQSVGEYMFYRVEIAVDGRWINFTAEE